MLRNGDYGIEVSQGSDNNSIHHNSFIENEQQAYDGGTNNQWYDDTVLEGYYWSDYDGTGSYLIAGPAGASDPCPIDDPYLKKGIDFFSILIRIGLFLGILGTLAVTIFLSRRR